MCQIDSMQLLSRFKAHNVQIEDLIDSGPSSIILFLEMQRKKCCFSAKQVFLIPNLFCTIIQWSVIAGYRKVWLKLVWRMSRWDTATGRPPLSSANNQPLLLEGRRAAVAGLTFILAWLTSAWESVNVIATQRIPRDGANPNRIFNTTPDSTYSDRCVFKLLGRELYTDCTWRIQKEQCDSRQHQQPCSQTHHFHYHFPSVCVPPSVNDAMEDHCNENEWPMYILCPLLCMLGESTLVLLLSLSVVVCFLSMLSQQGRADTNLEWPGKQNWLCFVFLSSCFTYSLLLCVHFFSSMQQDDHFSPVLVPFSLLVASPMCFGGRFMRWVFLEWWSSGCWTLLLLIKISPFHCISLLSGPSPILIICGLTDVFWGVVHAVSFFGAMIIWLLYSPSANLNLTLPLYSFLLINRLEAYLLLSTDWWFNWCTYYECWTVLRQRLLSFLIMLLYFCKYRVSDVLACFLCWQSLFFYQNSRGSSPGVCC